MKKHIIFDVGGVLVLSSASELLANLDKGLSELSERERRELKNQIWSSEHINKELFYFIEENKERFDYSILTNNISGAERFLRGKFGINKFYSNFVCSGETGIAKPDLAAFKHILKLVPQAPDQCIFVDDQEENVAAAKRAGMRAILYKDFDSFKVAFENSTK